MEGVDVPLKMSDPMSVHLNVHCRKSEHLIMNQGWMCKKLSIKEALQKNPNDNIQRLLIRDI